MAQCFYFRLIVPVGVETEGWYCLFFYRHMYGYHVGALQVYVRSTETGFDSARWTTKGDNTPNWYPQYVSLNLVPGEEVRTNSYRTWVHEITLLQ